jgi:hypothetical protein
LSPTANPLVVSQKLLVLSEVILVPESAKLISVPDALAVVVSNSSDTNGSFRAVYSILRPLVISSLGYIN